MSYYLQLLPIIRNPALRALKLALQTVFKIVTQLLQKYVDIVNVSCYTSNSEQFTVWRRKS